MKATFFFERTKFNIFYLVYERRVSIINNKWSDNFDDSIVKDGAIGVEVKKVEEMVKERAVKSGSS